MQKETRMDKLWIESIYDYHKQTRFLRCRFNDKVYYIPAYNKHGHKLLAMLEIAGIKCNPTDALLFKNKALDIVLINNKVASARIIG